MVKVLKGIKIVDIPLLEIANQSLIQDLWDARVAIIFGLVIGLIITKLAGMGSGS